MATRPRHQRSDADDLPARGTGVTIASWLTSAAIAGGAGAGGVVTEAVTLVAVAALSTSGAIVTALLLAAGRKVKRSTATHDRSGYGREHFFWAFIVALATSAAAAAVAIAMGVDRLRDPAPLVDVEVALGILGAAAVAKALTLRAAIRAADEARGEARFATFLRHARAPELPVVTVVDTLAVVALTVGLAGVAATEYASVADADAWAAIAVGAVAALAAVALTVVMRSLLLPGEAGRRQGEAIRAAIEIEPNVVGIVDLHTDRLGPDELLVGAKVEVLADLSIPELSATIDRVERSIRTGVPAARIIYLEPTASDDVRAGAFVEEHEGHIDVTDPRYREVAGTDAGPDGDDIWS